MITSKEVQVKILFIFNLLSRKCTQEGDVLCLVCANITALNRLVNQQTEENNTI